MANVYDLIATAENELGYLEKKSNASLDSKTANAGSGNYTKYNRDYIQWDKGGSINMQWCAAFVSWCFVMTFGLTEGKRLLCGGVHCYTPTGADRFKKAGRYIKRGAGLPCPGDVVYFYVKSKGRIGHVGIVVSCDGKRVTTIEGNASDGVRRKSYALTDTYIDGYGRPDYDEGGEKVVIRGGNCWIRTAPSLLGRQLGVAKAGTTFDYAGETDGWMKIRYGETDAYVSKKYAVRL